MNDKRIDERPRTVSDPAKCKSMVLRVSIAWSKANNEPNTRKKNIFSVASARG
jgi:hypothetical protein